MTATMRYRLERLAGAKYDAWQIERASLKAVATFARNKLSEPCSISEIEVLPIGCECIRRVGTLYPAGNVRWRRR